MKISKSKLIQMIKEEMVNEDDEWVDANKLKSQAEHGPYAEDEFKKDMENTLSRVASDELSFEEAMDEFNVFLDKYKPPVGPEEDDPWSGPGTYTGFEDLWGVDPEEETIEVSDEEPEEEAVRPKTPTGASHRRMRGQQRTTGAKLSPETQRMLRKK